MSPPTQGGPGGGSSANPRICSHCFDCGRDTSGDVCNVRRYNTHYLCNSTENHSPLHGLAP